MSPFEKFKEEFASKKKFHSLLMGDHVKYTVHKTRYF